MQIFSHTNPFKEKVLLLEKDNREKIKKPFKVNQDIADFAHNINDNLSIWIVDKLFEQLIQERHFTRDQVIAFLNSSDNDKDNYLQLFQTKIVSILDYYANPEGKREYPSFDDFKKERFDILYNKSDVWHKGLKSVSKKTTEIVDTEPGIKIIKKYEPDSNGTIYYWADLNTKYSQIESSRMGHCGTTHKGTTLLSLRSFTPSLNDSYISKSHITISLNRDRKYYTQCKGKQNRKPAIQYRDYIFDLFMFEPDIQKYEVEYNSGTDFTVLDLLNIQILELKRIKNKLVSQFISTTSEEIEKDAESLSPQELYKKYFEDGYFKNTDNFKNFKTNQGVLPPDKVFTLIMNIILPAIITDLSVFNQVIEYINDSPDQLDMSDSIIEYCIFSNNFSKIKKRITELFEKYQNVSFEKYIQLTNVEINVINNIKFFSYFTKKYPDYFTSYGYKKIEPLVNSILLDDDIQFKDIIKYFGIETKDIIIAYINKNKDNEKVKNIYYLIIYENLHNYVTMEIERDNRIESIDILDLGEDGLDQLIFKIRESNNLLKGDINYDKYQELIHDDLFHRDSFTSFTILALYKHDPTLLNYSLYEDFDPEYLNNKIETQLDLSDYDYQFFSYSKGKQISSFENELGDFFAREVFSEDIENFLNNISDKSKVSSKEIYKKTLDKIKERMESLTDRTFDELEQEYIEEENASNYRYRFYDVYQYTFNTYNIEELNNDISSAIEGADSDAYSNELFKLFCNEIIKFFQEKLYLPLDENRMYLYEDTVYVVISVKDMIDNLLMAISDLAPYTSGINLKYNNVVKDYIGAVKYNSHFNQSIYTDSISSYFSDEDVCNYFMDNY
jgi:hypothetical protein